MNCVVCCTPTLINWIFPLDTGNKLNVHRTFGRRPGRLLNVLCTFNLRSLFRGLILQLPLHFFTFPSMHFCFNFCQTDTDISLLVRYLIPFSSARMEFFWFFFFFIFWFHFDFQFVKSFLLIRNLYAKLFYFLKKHAKENHLRYVTSRFAAVIVVLKSKYFDFKTTIIERWN